MNMRLWVALLGLLTAVLWVTTITSVAAQTGGTLQGSVLDDQGLALPGATVTFS